MARFVVADAVLGVGGDGGGWQDLMVTDGQTVSGDHIGS